MKRFIIAAALLSCAAVAVEAKVELPPVISDNMVLQQKTEASLWGKAKPKSNVTVITGWNSGKYTVKAGADGKWSVKVSTQEAGGPYTVSISDGEELVLNNVLLGEVWFCGGQSNMSMPMCGFAKQPVEGAADYIIRARPDVPVRICNVDRKSSRTAEETHGGSWQENTPGTVSRTSAIAYLFAEYLQKVIDVPVGIIVSAWGGSTIETWLSKDVVKKNFADDFKEDIEYLDGKMEKAVREAHKSASLLYNGMVNPLVPYTFKGMLWYQGCSNRSVPALYTRMQVEYVKMMRELFQVPDAPFYFVEIAPYRYDSAGSFKSGYFREAQAKTLDLIPHSGMATTSDVGAYATIHPSKKVEVAHRLAYLALQNDYKVEGFQANPPRYRGVTFRDGKAWLKIEVQSLGISPMGDLPGFEIAGADRVFKPAKACVGKERGSLTVWSEEVPEPAAVRYCFRNWGQAGLYNNFGIPAAVFRTDDWDDIEK